MIVRGTKTGQLFLASIGFFWCFLMWFATAAFSAAIIDKYGLSRAEFAILASSALWLAPIGRVMAGYLADKIGAPNTFTLVLAYTGIFSIVSAYVTDYGSLFITRLIVATAGISFVVGIQHVAQWFDDHEIGLAEGLYAGTGNVGAGVGAMLLPRIYGLDYHTAFLHLGIVALVLAVIYKWRGVAAASAERAHHASQGASAKEVFYIMTRFAAIALMLQYAMSFGLEIAMNAWLPGYYKLGFEEQLKALGYTDLKAMAIAAGSFAAVQSFNASLWRPFSGFISDVFQRNHWTPWPFINKEVPWAPRIHWAFTAMVAITIMMVALTYAGLTGMLPLSVVILALLGVCISFGTGSCFGLVPIIFRRNPGLATGFIGGFSCIGGIVYPLVYGNVTNIHMGYLYVAVALFVPFMLFFAFTFLRGRKVNIDSGFGSRSAWGLPSTAREAA